MAELSRSRSLEPDHHVSQGIVWLERSNRGANTTDLSYAAFEFRLAIEMLAVRHWRQLLGRKVEEQDLRDIDSFKQTERRIYELAGHQREINRHFEFMRVVLALLKIDIRLVAPNLGQLSKFWHECSRLCHIEWTLCANSPELRAHTFKSMEEVRDVLTEQTNGVAYWPAIGEGPFRDLRNRFVEGKADADDVKAYLQTTGAWAQVDYPDGRLSHFAGTPIPPNKNP